MEVIVQSIHFTCKAPLREFIFAKVEKLKHFASRLEFADVTLKLLDTSERENKVCEIHLREGSYDHFACKKGETFEKAVTAVAAALQEQIRKNKI